MNTVNKLSNGKYKVENIFLTIALIFGLITVFIQPIFSAPDEFVHFKHAYSTFHDDTDKLFEEVDKLTTSIPYEGPELNENALNSPEASFAFESAYKDGSFIQKYFKDKVTSTGTLGWNLNFSRLVWLPQALGILIGSFVHSSFGVMIIAGRLLNLLVYILAIYFAIKKAKIGQWVMAAIALLPISIQQAASLSYDVLYYVAIFACFSLLTNLWKRKYKLDWHWLLYILSIIIVLFIPKTAVLALGLFFLTLPTRIFGENKLTRLIDRFWDFWAKHKKLSVIIILLIIYTIFVYEFRQYGGAVRGVQIMFNTFFRADFYNNMDSVLVSGMIGNFGQMTYRLPAWLIVIDFIFIFLIALNEQETYLDKRVAVAGVLTYFLVIILIAINMYMNWTLNKLNIAGALISLGNQGRYYTPFLIVLLPAVLQLKKYIKVDMKGYILRRSFLFIVSVNLVYFLLLTVLFYYADDRGANLFPNILFWIRDLI